MIEPVIRTIGLSRSQLFELRRLLRGLAAVYQSADHGGEFDDDLLLVCDLTEATAAIREMTSASSSNLSSLIVHAAATDRLLLLVAHDHARYQSGGTPRSPKFNLADPKQRLAMLSVVSERILLARADREDLSDEVWSYFRMHPLYWHMCVAQRVSSAHLRPSRLAVMLGIDRTTLRRWFAAERLLAPDLVLCWIRLAQVAGALRAESLHVDAVAFRLGYSSSNALRRSLRRVANLSPGVLRSDAGQRRFHRALKASLEGQRHLC
ncbi:MAG: helix-turn-helix domain-containing protein [Gemmatimonas sp.]|jgi:AraC-like DNA-binding protein|uniref:helix-turn-helix domain-containing protein n=1 Tax=Gemmatimonas sp. TaxID=1962908 RepID=UPI00391FB125